MKLRNMDENKKTGKILFEAGILIMVVNLLCAVGIWQSILHGWKVSADGELFFQAFVQSGGKYVITYLNQESIYISFLSVVFSFLGNKEELVSIINLILQLAGVGFFYLGAKKLFRFVFPLAISVICGLLSGCFYPVIADSSMHMIWFLTGLIFWIGTKLFCDLSGKFMKWILLGILLGISCYVDLAGFFLLVTFLLFNLIAGEFELKQKGLQLLYFLLSSISGFFCMFYLWNNFLLDTDVFNHWLNDKIKYMALETSLNQYISLGLVLVVSIIFYVIKRSRKMVGIPVIQEAAAEETVKAEETTIQEDTTEGTVKAEETAISETTAEETVKAEEAVIPETTVEETVKAEETVISEANSEQLSKQKEDVINQTAEKEVKKPIKFIENPLPLPKKHVKKEMNYAFEPSSDQMHYDLNNYRLDDDYDLKDI